MLLYNTGCIYALAGMHEEALDSLERAVKAGLTQKEWYENDPDLSELRTQDRFIKLLRTLDSIVCT